MASSEANHAGVSGNQGTAPEASQGATSTPRQATTMLPGYGAYGGGYGGGYGGAGYTGGYYGGYGMGGGYLGNFYGPGTYYGGLGSGLYGGYAALASRFTNGVVNDGHSTTSQALGVLQSVMAPGQSAMATLQNVMHAIARVTGILEENMRTIHILFDSVFGLVYNLTFLREELRGALQHFRPKSWFTEWLQRILGLWRLLLLLALTPFSLRLPPVAAVLRFLGLVPREQQPIENDSDTDSFSDTDSEESHHVGASNPRTTLSWSARTAAAAANERQSL
jgi:hypothetical protein